MIYTFVYADYVTRDSEKEKEIYELVNKKTDTDWQEVQSAMQEVKRIWFDVQLIHKETNYIHNFSKVCTPQVDEARGEEYIQLKKGRLYASDYFNKYYCERIENKKQFFIDFKTAYKGVGIARALERLIDYMRTQEAQIGDILAPINEGQVYLFEVIEDGYKYLGGGKHA